MAVFEFRVLSVECLESSLLRLFPPLFEFRFPVLRPRPPEVVDVAFVHRRQLRRSSIRPIDDGALDAALDVRESLLGIVERACSLPWSDCVQRTRERLGIVER